MTATVVKQSVAGDVSTNVNFRVVISRNAASSATISGTSAISRQDSGVGWIISNTPQNPAITADHRRHPTRSESRNGARAVKNSGPTKTMAITSASGMIPIAKMNR